MIKNQNEFKTTDNHLNGLGWTILGGEFINAKSDESNRVIFYFKNSEKTEKAINNFLQDKPCSMGVRSILSLLQSFRQMIFDARK